MKRDVARRGDGEDGGLMTAGDGAVRRVFGKKSGRTGGKNRRFPVMVSMTRGCGTREAGRVFCERSRGGKGENRKRSAGRGGKRIART